MSGTFIIYWEAVNNKTIFNKKTMEWPYLACGPLSFVFQLSLLFFWITSPSYQLSGGKESRAVDVGASISA